MGEVAVKMIQKGIICVIVFAVILSISFYLFSVEVTNMTSQVASERLIESSSNNARALKVMFFKDIGFLKSIASDIAEAGDISGSEVLNIVKSISPYTSFQVLAIDTPNGKSYTSNGDVLDVSDMKYLQDVLEGESVVSKISSAQQTKTPNIAVIVPIFKDSKVIGALRGVYDAPTFLDAVEISTFNGGGFFLMVDKQGAFISKTNNPLNNINKGNLFDILTNREFDKGFSLEQIINGMNNSESGFSVYRLNGKIMCAYYMPIGINDWYAMSIVDAEHMSIEKRAIDSSATVLIAVIVALFAILMVYLVYQSREFGKKTEEDNLFLQNTLNAIPLPIFISREDRRITYANDASIELFGKSRNKVLGMKCRILGTNVCGTENCSVKRLCETGNPLNFVKKDGRSFRIHSAILSVPKKSENTYIEIVQDIYRYDRNSELIIR